MDRSTVTDADTSFVDGLVASNGLLCVHTTPTGGALLEGSRDNLELTRGGVLTLVGLLLDTVGATHADIAGFLTGPEHNP